MLVQRWVASGDRSREGRALKRTARGWWGLILCPGAICKEDAASWVAVGFRQGLVEAADAVRCEHGGPPVCESAV